jgi:hypothetical protein
MNLNNIGQSVKSLLDDSIMESVHAPIIDFVDMMVDISIEISVWKPVRGSVAFMGKEEV